MALPDRSREQVLAALRKFDDRLRANEHSMSSTKFVLVHKGREYPPKRIVALATGVDYRMFSGGKPTNDYLTKRGFTVEQRA
jgi:hypothetical protein